MLPSNLSIPGKLNIAIFFVAASVCILCLKICSSGYYSILPGLVAAIVFSYFANTIFALLHEAVHGVFSANRKTNYMFGVFAGCFFPTSYNLQKMYHLSHHTNNRSEFEQFDYIHEHDNKWLKYAQWYSILTGIYWVVAVLGALIVLILPNFFKTRLLKGDIGKQTGAVSVFHKFDKKNHNQIRAELLLATLFQLSVIYVLHITFYGWLLCYGCFAVNWSGLQYADHAFSELDAKNGAWNLKVNVITQYLFLNYHFHKVHHNNMKIPWVYLPKYADPSDKRPSFWSIYLKMWRGPRIFPSSAIN